MDSTGISTLARILVLMFLASIGSGLAHASSGFPMSPRPRVLDARDGLPSMDLGPVTIDKQGYVWVGTEDGLARYDGVGFRVWRYDPKDTNGLQSNTIADLALDNAGRIWVATQNGLSVLDAGRKHFTTYLKSKFPQMGADEIIVEEVTMDCSNRFQELIEAASSRLLLLTVPVTSGCTGSTGCRSTRILSEVGV